MTGSIDFAITETAPGHWLPWGRLPESVRSGRPMARDALGMELFDWYAQNPEEAGFFSAAMGNLSALAAISRSPVAVPTESDTWRRW